MKKILVTAILSVVALASVQRANAQSVFGLTTRGGCCKGCGCGVCIRPYNAFSPVLCGTVCSECSAPCGKSCDCGHGHDQGPQGPPMVGAPPMPMQPMMPMANMMPMMPMPYGQPMPPPPPPPGQKPPGTVAEAPGALPYGMVQPTAYYAPSYYPAYYYGYPQMMPMPMFGGYYYPQPGGY